MIKMPYILCCFFMTILIVGFTEETEAKAKDIEVEAVVELGQYKELRLLNDPVIIRNGRALLPIREVGDKLSLRVYWDQSTKTASLYGVNKEIKLTIGIISPTLITSKYL
ncbi:copper amine oxidase N-terminal domain-containing protein [Paenibacillaceae bacterium]|nr:copper amine oxidase N-terminal domain-containing protein [Paenibacillaceae bacterium]